MLSTKGRSVAILILACCTASPVVAQTRGGTAGAGGGFSGTPRGSSFAGSTGAGGGFGGVAGGATRGTNFNGAGSGGANFSGASFSGAASFMGSSFSGQQSGSFSGTTSGTSFAGGRTAGSGDPFAASRGSPFTQNQLGAGNASGMPNRNFNSGAQFGNTGNNRFNTGFNNQFGMNQMGRGFNNFGSTNSAANTTPGYVLRAGFPEASPPTATEVQPRLQAVIARSERLKASGRVRVEAEGGALVLRGHVATSADKALAEAMLRLEPGVYELRNELTVGQPVPEPEPPPMPKPNG